MFSAAPEESDRLLRAESGYGPGSQRIPGFLLNPSSAIYNIIERLPKREKRTPAISDGLPIITINYHLHTGEYKQ
jgi:hypothetical protein